MPELDYSGLFEEEDIVSFDKNKKTTFDYSNILEDEEKEQETQKVNGQQVDYSGITEDEEKLQQEAEQVEKDDYEVDNEVGVVESVLSGIASGLIKIPEGFVSLGAELIDLGADTNNAAKVEQFFDKINPFDEKAEATAAGKITELLVNIGVPGGIAFSKGASLASKVLKSQKNRKRFTINKTSKPLKDAADEALELNAKGKVRKYVAGSLGAGAAEGVFVADVEDAGTISDLVKDKPLGVLALERDDPDDPGQALINRLKFGTEGALFTGLIGGTGATIKKMATSTDDLLRSNKKIDNILGRIGAALRPQSKDPTEIFEAKRKQIGTKRVDIERARVAQKNIDKKLNKLFPLLKGPFYNKTATKDRTKALKLINDLLTGKKLRVSQKKGARKVEDVYDQPTLKEGVVTFGPLDGTLKTLTRKFLESKGANPKQIREIFSSLEDIRSDWGSLFTDGFGGLKIPKDNMDDFLKEFGAKAMRYLDNTYEVFRKDRLLPLLNYKPSEAVINRAREVFKRIAASNGKTLTDEQADAAIDNLVKSARLPQSVSFFLRGDKGPDPIIQLPRFFLKDSAADDLAKKVAADKNFGGFASVDDFVDEDLSRLGYVSIGKTRDAELKAIFNELLGKQENALLTIMSGTERLSNYVRAVGLYDDALKAGENKLFFKSFADAEKAFPTGTVLKPIKFGQEGLDPSGKFQPVAGSEANPLNGLITDELTFEALKTTKQVEKSLTNNLYDNFILYPKATSQMAKTILSPITHMRNFISATAFATANGIIPGVTISPTKMKQAFDTAFGGAVGKGRAADNQKFYEELLELGVVNTNVRGQELQKLMEDIDYGANFTAIRALKGLSKKLGRIRKGAEDIYTAEDDFWKITNYSVELQRLKDAYATAAKKGLVQDVPDIKILKQRAADIVKKTVPNYDYVSDTIKSIRKLPFGNFVSFPAEIIRTGAGIVDTALSQIKDPVTGSLNFIKSTNPEKLLGLKRLLGFGVTTTALPYGIQEGFKVLYDVTEDEMNAMKRYVPDWSKNSVLIPIRDEKTGRLKYIDFSHSNAYDTLSRPVQTVINAVAEGREDGDGVADDFFKGLIESTKELGEPFLSEAIWSEALIDISLRNGVTNRGSRVYNPDADLDEKIEKSIQHLIKTQVPGSFEQLKRLDKSIKPVDIITRGPTADSDKYGTQYEFSDEFLGLFGFRAINLDPERTFNFKLAAFDKTKGNARRLFTTELLKGGVVQPEDIVDRYMLANKVSYDAYKELRQDYIAALRLKANREKLKKEFDDRGKKKDFQRIELGRFEPFKISDGIKDAFADNARELGVVNPYSVAERQINNLYDLYRNLPIGLPDFPMFPNPFREARELFPATTAPKYLDSVVPGVTPDILPMSGNLQNVNPQTGNTNVETALLDPDDQAIARNLRR